MHAVRPAARRCKPALGTFVEIAILDDVADARDDAFDAAFGAAFGAIARVMQRMSFHDPASDLSRINREAATRAVRVDPWTIDVLAAAADLHERTAGRFDCAIAPLLVERGWLPGRPDPTRGSFADVSLDRQALSVSFRTPLLLDLGGIAKGFAVDRAIDALAARGVRHAVVNAGGDLRVLGERGVPVHVRRSDAAAPLRVGELADGAFASSAGVRARHHAPGALVDARARRVIEDDRVWSVIAPTCLLADALTKVVATGGPEIDATLATFGATALVH